MFEAILFLIISIAIIMGGAMVLLNTAKKPKISKTIKSPEQLDKEDDEYKNG
jgi:hypothetical protein